MTNSTLLNIQKLNVQFDTENGLIKAVDDIDFQLNKGEILGIVGESGSGKSMTALSIMKLVPQIATVRGNVIFLNEKGDKIDIIESSKDKIQHIRGSEIGMIFQEPMTSLNPVFKCGNQIVEAIQRHQQLHKEDARNVVLDLFRKVKLPEVERIFNAYPHQLSGGQKQRVMIAMALCCHPKILIADEPTTALDVTVQKAILELIKNLQKELKMSVIFISHDLGVIAEICDKVLVMFKGKIVEMGEVEDIFKKPSHPYTKSLLACRPPLEFRLKRLPVMEDFLEIKYDENNNIDIIEKDNSAIDLIKNRIDPNFYRADNQPSKELLKVENLKKWFPSNSNFLGKPTSYTKAVDEVSFELFEGETLGLVGESGCGKTTLGRTILRLIEADSGKIFYQNRDILKISMNEFRKLRKHFQIIFQDPYSSLNPRQPIGNAIIEPMTFHNLFNNQKERKEKAIELMELVGLKSDFFYRMPHQFSGGQRQRICIARALATQPKFIICDECVSSLDVSIQAQILNLLMELKENQNLTYLFISHDLSVVKFMSDRMMVMKEGKIVEFGEAEEIYKNPKSTYTQQLINAIPKGI